MQIKMVACGAELKLMLQREVSELNHISRKKTQVVSKKVGVAANHFKNFSIRTWFVVFTWGTYAQFFFGHFFQANVSLSVQAFLVIIYTKKLFLLRGSCNTEVVSCNQTFMSWICNTYRSGCHCSVHISHTGSTSSITQNSYNLNDIIKG